MHELNFWRREDRHYCESAFFRSRVVPDEPASLSAENCRAELARRNFSCYQECDACSAFCTDPTIRGLAVASKCSFELPTIGLAVASQITDMGQNIVQRHGAQRSVGRPPNPDESWAEQFRTLVNNDINAPRVARNAISCRKEHRESTFGHYVPSLNENGDPVLRSGFMIGCSTDSDCYSRCGEHPISGNPYVCTQNPRFYSFFQVNRNRFLNITWSKQYSYITSPGDERFDPQERLPGVCTDTRYDHAYTGCTSNGHAAATVGFLGCTAKFGWARSNCGVLTERPRSDFLDVTISEASLVYPRTLVPASEVNGVAVQAVICEDELECVNKCQIYNMIARDGNLPAPEACALCEPICPNNIVTSILSTAEGLWADINTAFRLGKLCFGELGIAACVCNLISTMKPAWVDRLPTAQQKCKGGNTFGLLVFKIVELISRVVDDSLNQLIIDPINDFVDFALGWAFPGDARPLKPIPQACISKFFNPPQFNCPTGSLEDSDLYSCYGGKGFAAVRTCYFERQNAICTANDDKYNSYLELFEAPDVQELGAQYREIVGDSYEFLTPTFKSLMESVASQAQQPDVKAAQNLCDASLFSTMDLDEVIEHTPKPSPLPLPPI